MKKQSVIFFGTSEFAVPTLKKLIAESYKIDAVVTQPDIKEISPIKQIALAHRIPVVQPKKLSLNDLKTYQADLGILVAYGQIINSEILNSFKLGIINLHPSLLPKYRGPSPMQYALLKHEQITGVSLIKLDKDLDSGPILAQKEINIDNDDNYLSLSKKLSTVGANLIINTLPRYINQQIQLTAQDNSQATFSKIINRNDGEVGLADIKNSPQKIITKLKAYTPWPGVYFTHQNKRFKIIKASLSNNQLRIELIQPAGKKSQSFHDFKNGYPDIKI